MGKGEETKRAILQRGLDMASQVGLEKVTIGSLAAAMDMSKSGLFAHFQSKENLQLEILEYAADDFAENVVIPAVRKPPGIERIRALVDRWVRWGAKLTGGCIFVTAATEFADRPGKVREALKRQQQEWIESLQKMADSAVKAGAFRTDADREQFAFDLYSLLLGFHYYQRMLDDTETRKRREAALERLLDTYRSTGEPRPAGH
ncbi:MAG: TetR/AcrR family transcriptional regulator [Desulfobacteraceae bacterium]|jgi:AcrR family transcriptional regulator|nr:TetR/AcrR family transcriptional regulator [Desulfobacteraceae bacterium]